MTNFKSGSGNLDFDSDDGSDSDDTESSTDSSARTDASSSDDPAATSESSAAGQTTDSAVQSAAGTGPETASEDPAGVDDGETYPYFVRRSNVGDERDTRLEIHVRDKVADGEAEFRHALATELGTSDVSKTDAREFALLAAFRHPERVAELMREEGFDSLG